MSDTRWVAGFNVGSVTLVIGVVLLVLYKVDPSLLYALQVAAGAVILGAIASIILLLQGLTLRSRRLKMVRFWVILIGNTLLVPALAVSIHHARKHPPAQVPSADPIDVPALVPDAPYGEHFA